MLDGFGVIIVEEQVTVAGGIVFLFVDCFSSFTLTMLVILGVIALLLVLDVDVSEVDFKAFVWDVF